MFIFKSDQQGESLLLPHEENFAKSLCSEKHSFPHFIEY